MGEEIKMVTTGKTTQSSVVVSLGTLALVLGSYAGFHYHQQKELACYQTEHTTIQTFETFKGRENLLS